MIKQNIIRSKKADKLLSIWWFLILIIIGSAVIIAVLIFASNRVDVRAVEADVLAGRIISCIAEQGYINQDFLDKKLDIFEKCNLNKKVLNESGNYFIKISIFDASAKLINEVSYGNSAFEKDCPITSIVAAKNYPRCATKVFSVLDSNNNNLKLNIITGSNSEYRIEA
jgi:hypothetical protein